MTRALLTRILIISGLCLLAGGLILGFLPKTANGVSCGSAFRGNDDAISADFGTTFSGSLTTEPLSGSYAADCADARSSAKTAPIVLLVLGGAALLGGVTAAANGTTKTERQPV